MFWDQNLHNVGNVLKYHWFVRLQMVQSELCKLKPKPKQTKKLCLGLAQARAPDLLAESPQGL